MRILVTGGAGFIGHNVVRFLEQQGHECFIVDNLTDYGFVPRDELRYLIRSRTKRFKANVHHIDICNAKALDNIFMSFHPEVVVHLASFPRQKVVSANPAWGSEVMSTGLVNLLESSRKNHVKRFTYISSSMVYGTFSSMADESHACNPEGQYGILKLAGEWLVKDYSRRGLFEHVIIRPSAVYGELDVEDRVVSKFMLSAMRGQTLKVNGSSEALDFTYVEDAAMGIVQATLSNNTANKTYNITKSHEHTLEYAANLAIKIAGQGTVEIRDKDQSFPSRGALDITAARRDFGYEPKVDVEEGFQRYHKWFKESSFWKSKL